MDPHRAVVPIVPDKHVKHMPSDPRAVNTQWALKTTTTGRTDIRLE